MQEYIRKMESPDRDEWQRPDEVVRAMDLSPGAIVAEIGAGIGYFTLRLARAVGERGHVFAVEVEEAILAELRRRLEAASVRNVSPIWAFEAEPLLPRGLCDRLLLVGVYHHFRDGPAMLRRLSEALAPNGRLANIDFHERELPVGPPVEKKRSREQFLVDAASAGLRVAGEHHFLPYHYFVELAAS